MCFRDGLAELIPSPHDAVLDDDNPCTASPTEPHDELLRFILINTDSKYIFISPQNVRREAGSSCMVSSSFAPGAGCSARPCWVPCSSHLHIPLHPSPSICILPHPCGHQLGRHRAEFPPTPAWVAPSTPENQVFGGLKADLCCSTHGGSSHPKALLPLQRRRTHNYQARS